MSARGLLLVVEDDPNDILLVRRGFRQAGVNAAVQHVEDGDAAIAYLAGIEPYTDRTRYPLPALVLLDLKLPRRSGFDVLEWIRGHSRLRRLPVVVLTSSQEARDIERAYDLGVNSYLTKPATVTELATTLAAVHRYWLELNHGPGLPRDDEGVTFR